MDPKALRNLHLDVRLQRRDRWIDSSELAQALDALPDVSDKIQPPEEAAAESAPAAGEALSPAPEAPAPPLSPPVFGREE
jgi:hypothetical protein